MWQINALALNFVHKICQNLNVRELDLLISLAKVNTQIFSYKHIVEVEKRQI